MNLCWEVLRQRLTTLAAWTRGMRDVSCKMRTNELAHSCNATFDLQHSILVAIYRGPVVAKPY